MHCVGATRTTRSVTRAVELGTILHVVQGADDAAFTHVVGLADFAAQQDFVGEAWQQACDFASGSRCGQKNRCSPVLHSHSGHCMPDQPAAGTRTATSSVRR
jgi:hypothetical protein